MELVSNLINSFKQFAVANRTDILNRFINSSLDDGKSDHYSGRAWAFQYLLNWIEQEVEPKVLGTTPPTATSSASLATPVTTTAIASADDVSSTTGATTTTVEIPLDSGN